MSHPHDQPTSVPIMREVLKWSVVLTVVIALVGGLIGWFVAGWPGVWSAVVAAVITLLFTGVTELSIILAARFDPIYFVALILGAWILKFLVFLGALALVKQLAFTHDWMLWSCMVVAMLGQLAIDVIVVARSRLGHVSDVRLPGDDEAR